MKTEVIKAELKHCAELAANLNEEQRNFITDNWDTSPIDGITDSFNASPLCWTILVDDKVAGMFGCTDDGVAWLTTAPEINNKTAIRFIRQSKEYIKQMVEYCGGLMSYAHRDNYRLINWLEWSGFEMCGTRGEFEIWVWPRHSQ